MLKVVPAVSLHFVCWLTEVSLSFLTNCKQLVFWEERENSVTVGCLMSIKSQRNRHKLLSASRLPKAQQQRIPTNERAGWGLCTGYVSCWWRGGVRRLCYGMRLMFVLRIIDTFKFSFVHKPVNERWFQTFDSAEQRYTKTAITKFNDVQDQRQYRCGRLPQRADECLCLCFHTADNTKNYTVSPVP